VCALHACSNTDPQAERVGPKRDAISGFADEELLGKLLPTQPAQNALSRLELVTPDRSLLSIRRITVPAYSIYYDAASIKNPVEVPLQARNQLVIRLKPEIGAEDIQALLSEYKLEPIDVAPELGLLIAQIQIQEPKAKVDLAVNSYEAVGELDISRIALSMKNDPRLLAVSPNSVLSSNQVSGLVLGRGPRSLTNGAAMEIVDWGMKDASIDAVWPRLNGSYSVGVVDVGFAPHSDLNLMSASTQSGLTHYHGNFVAGIMCARHNNIGVRGVLKNCTVVYSASPQVLTRYGRIEGDVASQATAVSAYMSEYLLGAYRLIRLHSNLNVVNVSLGYNWIADLGIDPRRDEKLRDIVRSQGMHALSLLEFAADRGVTIVSAAGNDSRGMSAPLDAQWSSPFNQASALMMREHQWSSALVVEAHDRTGVRASFSNVGGGISCPGVDVQSTVASPVNWIGIDDGTSMATPYCAAALVALRALMPSLEQREAIACLRRSDRQRDGVPRLNLKYAIENCASGPLAASLNDRAENQKVRIEAMSELPSLVTANIGCKYDLRQEFRVTPVVDLGDGQGPEFSDPRSRDEVRKYTSTLIERNCREPVFIVMPLGFDQNAENRDLFAQALMSEVFKARYRGGVAIIHWPLFGEYGDLQTLTDRVVVMVGDAGFRERLDQPSPAN
jgi:subtilisin family serine protease